MVDAVVGDNVARHGSVFEVLEWMMKSPEYIIVKQGTTYTTLDQVTDQTIVYRVVRDQMRQWLFMNGHVPKGKRLR